MRAFIAMILVICVLPSVSAQEKPIQLADLHSWRGDWQKKINEAAENVVAVEAIQMKMKDEFKAKYANKPIVGTATLFNVTRIGESISVGVRFGKEQETFFKVMCDPKTNDVTALRKNDETIVQGTIGSIVENPFLAAKDADVHIIKGKVTKK